MKTFMRGYLLEVTCSCGNVEGEIRLWIVRGIWPHRKYTYVIPKKKPFTRVPFWENTGSRKMYRKDVILCKKTPKRYRLRELTESEMFLEKL